MGLLGRASRLSSAFLQFELMPLLLACVDLPPCLWDSHTPKLGLSRVPRATAVVLQVSSLAGPPLHGLPHLSGLSLALTLTSVFKDLLESLDSSGSSTQTHFFSALDSHLPNKNLGVRKDELQREVRYHTLRF